MRILSVFFFWGGVALLSALFSCNSETISIDISNEIIVPRNYKIPYADQPLVIDGKDTEPSWQNAPFSEDFIDIEGQKETAQNTRLKMLWDQDFLYIYAKLEEKHIWATLKKRDTIIFYNNDFEVFISPSNSNHNYGEIEINEIFFAIFRC